MMMDGNTVVYSLSKLLNNIIQPQDFFLITKF